MVGRSPLALVSSIALLACAANKPSPSTPAISDTHAAGAAPSGSASAGAGTATTPSPPTSSAAPLLSDEQILSRVRSDLLACYQHGKKSTPSMADGKLTLLASIDASGRTTCVVPTDDTGLTQEVEDCMSARLARETYAPGRAWSFELPIAVRSGAVGLGKETTGPEIEDISAHGLPDAGKVVESLLPRLSECVQPVDKSSGLRVIHIGARVGSDGRVSCAVAASAGAVPEEVRTCSRSTLESAKFNAPKSGAGLVSIPVKILGAK